MVAEQPPARVPHELSSPGARPGPREYPRLHLVRQPRHPLREECREPHPLAGHPRGRVPEALGGGGRGEGAVELSAQGPQRVRQGPRLGQARGARPGGRARRARASPGLDLGQGPHLPVVGRVHPAVDRPARHVPPHPQDALRRPARLRRLPGEVPRHVAPGPPQGIRHPENGPRQGCPDRDAPGVQGEAPGRSRPVPPTRTYTGAAPLRRARRFRAVPAPGPPPLGPPPRPPPPPTSRSGRVPWGSWRSSRSGKGRRTSRCG